jgi:OmpA-OmpF porin, OOP family
MTSSSRVPGILVFGLLLSGIVVPAEGQVLDRLRDRAREAAEREAAAQVDRQVTEAVRCAARDQTCIDRARSEGQEVQIVEADGQPAPTEGAQPARQSPGQGAWANYDFVPGEQVLFAEDFSRDRVGNFPQRLEFLNGNAEVVTWNEGRWLRASEWIAFAVPLPEVLPERFTVEFQVTLPWWGMTIYGGPDGMVGEGQSNPSERSHHYIELGCCAVGIRGAGGQSGSVADARSRFDLPQGIDGHLFDVRVQGDGRYLKLYLNEQRLANIPNADFKRSDKLYFEIRPSHENPVMLGNLTINAGGRVMYDALLAEGRVSTQGILFDTGSDRIRPESTPTLNEILGMLKDHPDLRLGIEGHTDSVGDAAMNQTLSEKRAAAVKVFLSENGIDANRLETAGFGPTKAVASNESPEGRQQNRRVDLVKL